MATNAQELSRRSFCKCSAATALSAMAFLTLGPKPALSQPGAVEAKMTQKQAAYQNTPKGAQQCDKCNLFQPPSACSSVEGEISPKGWCNKFQLHVLP